VHPNDQKDFIPNAFPNKTNTTITLITDKSQKQFATYSSGTVTVRPTIKDIGTQPITIICYVSENEKYFQTINIKVGFDKNSDLYSKYYEVTGKITKISKTGVVRVTFNQNMKPLSNINLINNDTLSV
jgi:hypothetical protein